MATFKVIFEFIEANAAGFNEVYYRDASSAADALKFPSTVISARLALLEQTNTFVRLRSSQADGLRVTSMLPINLKGIITYSNSGPAPAGVAIVCGLGGAGGGTRKLWLRGASEAWIERNGQTGADQPRPTLQKNLTTYFTELQNAGFGIRRLSPPAPGPLAYRKILTVDGSRGDGTTDVTLDAPPGYPVPGRVIIGGASKKDLPALNGHFTIIKVNGAVVTIPYVTPNDQKLDGAAAKMRQEVYQALSVFQLSLCAFDHFGTRTTRAPLFHSRGARRAQHLRASP
jgi:hypothetical protein